MRKLFIALILLVVVAPAQAQWQALMPGLEYRYVRLAGFRGESLHQVRVDLTRLRLGVLYAPDYGSPALSTSKMARHSGALVAINAAFFDEQQQPQGYLREGSRSFVDQIATGAAFTGVFRLTSLGPEILHRDRFSPERETLAMQAGPRLVSQGKPVGGLLEERRRRRTGMAIDTQGRLVLYASGLCLGLTLEESQRALLLPPSQGGIEPLTVLNLDGGRSTQLTIKAGRTRLTVPGLRPVPVALGIFE